MMSFENDLKKFSTHIITAAEYRTYLYDMGLHFTPSLEGVEHESLFRKYTLKNMR